jgi:hypothetical protein
MPARRIKKGEPGYGKKKFVATGTYKGKKPRAAQQGALLVVQDVEQEARLEDCQVMQHAPDDRAFLESLGRFYLVALPVLLLLGGLARWCSDG